MTHPALDPAHRLLVCLSVGVRLRDPVIVKQIADQADKTLSDSTAARAFQRLPSYGVSKEDLEWLASADL